MNLNKIRARLTGGFHPFAIRTSDGREYEVLHPENVLVAPTSLAVVDHDREIVTVDSLHIVSIKNLPLKKNGSKHK